MAFSAPKIKHKNQQGVFLGASRESSQIKRLSNWALKDGYVHARKN